MLVKIEAAPGNPSDLQTTIQRRVDLTGAVEALLQYKNEMTAGQVLIKPG